MKGLDLKADEDGVAAYGAQGKPRGRKPKAKAKSAAKQKGKRSKGKGKKAKTGGSKAKAHQVEQSADAWGEWGWPWENTEYEDEEGDPEGDLEAFAAASAASAPRARKSKSKVPKTKASKPEGEASGKKESKRRKIEGAEVAEVAEPQFSVPEDCIPAPSHCSANGVYSTAYRRAQGLEWSAADCREAGQKASWLLRTHQKISPSLSGHPRAPRGKKVVPKPKA